MVVQGKDGGVAVARESIDLRTRFKVLRRDHFTCMYCGARPPYVRLHVDHVVAVSRGGSSDERNLITACSDCNLGKSNIEFDHPRPDGARYKPLAESKCPRATCGGEKKGRDAAEIECLCNGCHGCDICGNDYCERAKFSASRLTRMASEKDGHGCQSIQWALETAMDLLKKYPDCDVLATCHDPKWLPLYEIRPDTQPWIRAAIARALLFTQEKAKSDATGAEN